MCITINKDLCFGAYLKCQFLKPQYISLPNHMHNQEDYKIKLIVVIKKHNIKSIRSIIQPFERFLNMIKNVIVIELIQSCIYSKVKNCSHKRRSLRHIGFYMTFSVTLDKQQLY